MAHVVSAASTRGLRHAVSINAARRWLWLATSLHCAWIDVAAAGPPPETPQPRGPASETSPPREPDAAAPVVAVPERPRPESRGMHGAAPRPHGDGSLDDVLVGSETRASAAEIRAYGNYAPNMWIPARLSAQARVSAESVVAFPASERTTWSATTLTRFRATYALRVPMLLGLELDPLVTVRANDQRGVAPAGRAFVSFDTRFVEIGAGLGVRAVVYETTFNGRSSIAHVPRLDGVGFLRFGARDGLHFAFRLGGYAQIRSSTPYPHLPVTMQIQTPLAKDQFAFLTWRVGLNDEAPPYTMWTDVSVRVRVTPKRLADIVFLGVTLLAIDDRLALGGGIEWRSRALGERRRSRVSYRTGRTRLVQHPIARSERHDDPVTRYVPRPP